MSRQNSEWTRLHLSRHVLVVYGVCPLYLPHWVNRVVHDLQKIIVFISSLFALFIKLLHPTYEINLLIVKGNSSAFVWF